MRRHLHILFFICFSIPVVTLVYFLLRVMYRSQILGGSINSQHLQMFLFLLLLGVGPLVTLYAAAFFSRWKWFRYVTLGIALICSVFFSFVGLVLNNSLMTVGLTSSVIAFICVSTTGLMRLREHAKQRPLSSRI